MFLSSVDPGGSVRSQLRILSVQCAPEGLSGCQFRAGYPVWSLLKSGFEHAPAAGCSSCGSLVETQLFGKFGTLVRPPAGSQGERATATSGAS